MKNHISLAKEYVENTTGWTGRYEKGPTYMIILDQYPNSAINKNSVPTPFIWDKHAMKMLGNVVAQATRFV